MSSGASYSRIPARQTQRRPGGCGCGRRISALRRRDGGSRLHSGPGMHAPKLLSPLLALLLVPLIGGKKASEPLGRQRVAVHFAIPRLAHHRSPFRRCAPGGSGGRGGEVRKFFPHDFQTGGAINAVARRGHVPSFVPSKVHPRHENTFDAIYGAGLAPRRPRVPPSGPRAPASLRTMPRARPPRRRADVWPASRLQHLGSFATGSSSLTRWVRASSPAARACVRVWCAQSMLNELACLESESAEAVRIDPAHQVPAG